MPGLPDVDLDAGALLRALLDHQVEFVVIGGIAAVAHGSPFVTEDLDITPESSGENHQRLSAALRELGAREVQDSQPESASQDPGVRRVVTPCGELDIVRVPSGTRGYADLIVDATQVTAWAVTFPVASLADGIRSKQAANRPQDQRVLPVLREILASRYAEQRSRTDSPPAGRDT